MSEFFKKLFLVLIIVTFSAGLAQAKTIRVGFAAEPYPPFTVPDASGNWTGWEVDLIKAVCEEAGLDYVLAPTAWDGIIPALLSKKLDMIMGSMSITDARLKVIDFSDKYYKTPTTIVGTKKMAFDASPSGLKGKIIGVQTATIHQTYATKYFKDAQIKEYQTQDEINQDLISGRIDATQADSLALEDFLKSDEGMSCCESKGNVADDPKILGLGVGVGIRKGDDALKDKINAAIKAIRANGKYDEISKKYFNFDIYGD
ncbi:MAG: transporter substrate-binding domain-containing protein [Desulfobacterales bacterium]|nr:transporter substrate-binding domain-containing protein [Desulfobacterales bacterium]